MMMKQLNQSIICNDGTKLSVQASRSHYCIPRNDFGPYTHVEVDYPTAVPHDDMLAFAEDIECPTETVYGYVPVGIVNEFIQTHGGIKEGKMP